MDALFPYAEGSQFFLKQNRAFCSTKQVAKMYFQQKRSLPMFEISTESSFSAAHHLNCYDGPCENVHGHNWNVRAVVACDKLNDIGVGVDFKTVKTALAGVLGKLDHGDLNTIFEPLGLNPSSENCAKYIYDKLAISLSGAVCRIVRVEVTETQGNTASYYK
jgi:6-pyruvoyltetrahydropterin/6-carboxytetrahydropterin synthase